jgi:hypothetical protein
MRNPRQSSTVHVETLGEELSVYDWQRRQVHALNPTASLVWRQCNGATTAKEMATELRRQLNVPEADAVVELTLRRLADADLLDEPLDLSTDRPGQTRRALLQRGVAVVLLPAISTIAAPTPLAAQSLGVPAVTAISPTKGVQATTVAVTITGTNFVVGSTTITATPDPVIGGTAITVQNVVVSSSTSLTASLVVPGVVVQSQTLRVTTPGGTSAPIAFLITRDPPTLTSITPATGARGTTVAVTLTGTDFYLPPDSTVGVLDDRVDVSGTGITVQNLVGVNRLTLTANFVIDAAAIVGARTVTVTTPAGTTGPVTFTVT